MVKKIYTHDKVLMKLFQKFPGLDGVQGFKLARESCHNVSEKGCNYMTETPNIQTDREKVLEAMLFASPESVELERLAEALGADIPLTRNLLDRMGENYVKNNSGIQLREVDGAYRLCTNPTYYPAVQRLLKKRTRQALSQPTLETLAIITFKQPITKSAIEEIRGINSDYCVSKLVECGLVEERGRLDAPRKPMLFGTTEQFLIFYDIKNVDELLNMTEFMQHAGEIPATEDAVQLSLADVSTANDITTDTEDYDNADGEL